MYIQHFSIPLHWKQPSIDLKERAEVDGKALNIRQYSVKVLTV